MTELEKNTEEKILEAAKDVFIRKGMDGARMQEIANKAGINKALLHYYYRTKEKLFLSVFKIALQSFLPKILHMLESDMSLFDKIRSFVKKYTSLLTRNPFIPMFILQEINRQPEQVIETIHSTGLQPEIFYRQVNDAIDKGEIHPIDPRQLVINMLALCVFPIIARPLVQGILFGGDKKEYSIFLDKRVEEVPEFIINAIKKEES